MKKSIKNPVVLITGSSRGIGKATLEAFLDKGYSVVLHGQKPHDELKDFCKKYSEDYLYPVYADLSFPEKRAYLIDAVIEHFGRLDVLVNNAGTIYREAKVLPNSKEWNSMLEVNLLAVADLIRMSVPYLNESDIASIVNISSIYGHVGTLDTLGYSIFKGAVNTLTRTLAKELAPKIRVNAVAPGNVRTDLTASGGNKITQYFDKVTPLQRSANPQEIAAGVVFLASPDASFITGQILTIDGGYSIR